MKVVKATEKDWRQIINQSPEATFFATPEWGEILEKSFGYKNESLIFELNQKKVLLPLYLFNEYGRLGIKFKEYLSVPFYNFGGLFPAQKITGEETRQIIDYLQFDKTASFVLCPSPFLKLKYPSRYKDQLYISHILRLRKNFNYLWRKVFISNKRRLIKRANEKGLKIKDVKDLDDVRIYYKIASHTLARKKADFLPTFIFYKNIFNLADKEKYIKWQLAFYKKQAIAGNLSFCFGRNIVAWLNCSLEKFWPLSAPAFLFYKVIRWGCEKDYRYYHFGASNFDKGIMKFKEEFGAKPYKHYTYKISGSLLKIRNLFLK